VERAAVNTRATTARIAKWLHRRWLRLVSPPVIAALIVATPGVFYLTACSRLPQPPAMGSKASAPKLPSRVPSAAENLSKSLDGLKATLSGVKDVASARKQVAAAQADLAKLDAGMQKDFVKTRAILRKVNSKDKDALQAKFERDYAAKMAKLTSGLQKLSTETDARTFAADARALGAWLASLDPKPKRQALGVSQLPHRIVDYHAGPPVLGTSIAPAYAPNLPNSVPSALPKTPTPEDVTETVEVQFTPEIRSLATSLGNDPVKMYEWVHNNIDFEPYYGSRKGAAETLAERSGNDMDTASLLVALCRVSGIPARYVQGVVDVPIDRARKWLGVETPIAASRLLASGGTPTASLISGGKTVAVQVEHVWVEVDVRYGDYRGIGGQTGDRRWVPLDASFKAYTPSGNMDSLVRQLIEQPSSATTDFASLTAKVSEATAAVRTWASARGEREVEAVIPHAIVPTRVGLLPPALPWKALPEREFREPQTRDMVSIGLDGGSTYSLPLLQAATSVIEVSYAPANSKDLELIKQYQTVLSVPAYLEMMLPVLRVNGEVIATGSPAAVGSTQDVNVAISTSGQTYDAGRTVFVGGIYSLTVDAGHMGGQSVGSVRNRLQDALGRAKSAVIGANEFTGPLLGSVGRAYFSQLDLLTSMFTVPAGVVDVHSPSALFVSVELAPSLMFGFPIRATPLGLSLDVRTNSHLTIARSDDSTSVARFSSVAGALSSVLESEVLSELFGSKAVSTATVFAEASKRGIELLHIDRDNLSTQLERLNASPGFKNTVASVVAEGHVVVVPAEPVPIGTWAGHGWLDIDPQTGATGYMIDALSGSLMQELQDATVNALEGVLGTLRDSALGAAFGALADSPAIVWAWSLRDKVYTEGLTLLQGPLLETYGPSVGMSLRALAEVIAVIGVPMLAVVGQLWGDWNNKDLSPAAKAERAAIVGVYWMMVTDMTVFAGLLVASKMGAVASAIVTGILGIVATAIWNVLKKDVLQLVPDNM
jgi:transglutaminase-like putative cysteine protease